VTGWHLGDDMVRRYVERADSLAEGASAEQHLLSCGPCRARVGAAVTAAASVTGLNVIDLAAVWDRTRDAVEVPRASVFERVLRGAGLPAAEARLVAEASAWVSPLRAAIAVSSAWLAVVWLLAARSGSPDAVLQGRAQAGFLALAAASSGIFLVRRRRLCQLRPGR
jgi:hypothetical protein